MMTRCVAMLSMVVLLAACNSSPDSSGEGSTGPVGSTSQLSFIALGDVGTGASHEDADHKQVAVAALIERVCAIRGCDFATAAGDNIYEQGVTAVNDPQFDDAFETPYQNLDFPFFMALGNHDNSAAHPLAEAGGFYGEGRNNAKGDFQVDYHAVSSKWYMPSRFYNVSWPMQASKPLLELFVIDANPVTHYVRDTDPEWSGDAYNQYIVDQTNWLNTQLDASTATWKFALAHHPYLSNGLHGNAGAYDSEATPDGCLTLTPIYSAAGNPTPVDGIDACRGVQYKQMLEQTICDKADVFLNGHDHDLQWLEPAVGCGKTKHLLSGAGAKVRSASDGNTARNPVVAQYFETWGFMWISLTQDSMTVAIYGMDASGESLVVDGNGEPLPSFEQTVARES